ncbi:MAG: acetoacetate decarboxylase family protein [Myxococcales bacterium]
MLRRQLHAWHARLGSNVKFPLPLTPLRMIKATFVPHDLHAYQLLLPLRLQMPDEPRVQLEFLESSPGWCEASVSLACKHGDSEGWYGLYWPIDSYVGYKLGRLVGYPKHLVRRMPMWDDGHAVRAQVVRGGRSEFSLALCLSSRGAPVSRLARGLVGPERERPWYLQVPPEQGPSLNRLTYSEVEPLQTRISYGELQLSDCEHHRWSSLLPRDGRVPDAALIERSGLGFGWLVAKQVAGQRTGYLAIQP